MRVLICGGRDFTDWEYLEAILTPMSNTWPDHSVIVHGGAWGVDKLASAWAEFAGFPTEEYPADWEKHGKAAGPIRNKQMLDTGVDVVIAFPGGKGTAHMVSIAKKEGVKVIEVPEN